MNLVYQQDLFFFLSLFLFSCSTYSVKVTLKLSLVFRGCPSWNDENIPYCIFLFQQSCHPCQMVGFPGSNGVPGVPGNPGFPGRDGTKGEKGSPGKRGARGVAGIPGKLGPRGPEGPRGQMGEKGVNGTGNPGNIGPRGSKGIKGKKGDAANIDPRQLANWKQCAWKSTIRTDSGKIKVLIIF